MKKLKDYFYYSNSIKKFNFDDQRRVLKKYIKIKDLIKRCESHFLGTLPLEKTNLSWQDTYDSVIINKISKTKTEKKKKTFATWLERDSDLVNKIQ